VTLTEDERRILLTALVYATQILAQMPQHWAQPHVLFEMDRLIGRLSEDEKQLQRARQVAASHVARMLKTERRA
jgi:hypothetical protein